MYTHTPTTHAQPSLATLVAWAYAVATHPQVYTDEVALASAEARIARLEAGMLLATDVQGLLDWAEAMGW